MIGIMFAIGALICYASLRGVSYEELVHDLQTLKWSWAMVAVLSMALSVVFEALVVKILVQQHLPHYPMKDAIRVPMIELLFNGITPFSTGGQPAQLFALMQSGVDGGRATSMLLMKFVVYQSMIVVNFIVCILIGFRFIADKLHVLSMLIIFGFLIHFAVIAGLIMIMYWYNFTKKMVRVMIKPLSLFLKSERLEKIKKSVDDKIDSFYEESLRLRADWGLLIKISLLTLVQLFFYYLIPYFILLSLGVTHVNVLLVMTMHVLIVMIISLFPIPGGVGGAELSFSMVFSTFISGHGKLVLAMLLWRAVTYYLVIFAGIVALAVKPDKIKTED